MSRLEQITDFLALSDNLKHEKTSEGESVYNYAFGDALKVLIYSKAQKPDIDVEKTLKMTLIDGLRKSESYQNLVETLPLDWQQNFADLSKELETNKTSESQYINKLKQGENKDSQLEDFLTEAYSLKDSMRFKGNECFSDSISEHSYGVALMSYIVADELNLKVDKTKLLELSITHDLCEYFVGDISNADVGNGTVNSFYKEEKEREGIQKICDYLPEGLGKKIHGLYEDFETAGTQNASYTVNVSRIFDKLEAPLHMSQCKNINFKDKQHELDTPHYQDKYVMTVPELFEFTRLVKEKLMGAYLDNGYACSDDFFELKK